MNYYIRVSSWMIACAFGLACSGAMAKARPILHGRSLVVEITYVELSDQTHKTFRFQSVPGRSPANLASPLSAIEVSKLINAEAKLDWAKKHVKGRILDKVEIPLAWGQKSPIPPNHKRTLGESKPTTATAAAKAFQISDLAIGSEAAGGRVNVDVRIQVPVASGEPSSNQERYFQVGLAAGETVAIGEVVRGSDPSHKETFRSLALLKLKSRTF